MKIELHELQKPKPTTLEQFAEAHDLVMEVHERDPKLVFNWTPQKRYYARFRGAEVKVGSMLASSSGDGETVEDAIFDYGRNISEKTLVIDAYQSSRRVIEVPKLYCQDPD